MKIREATKKDISQVLRLLNSDKNLVCGNGLTYEKGDALEYINNPINKTFVYILNDKVVGMIVTQFWRKQKIAYINVLIVDKNYRKHGIATNLINYSEKLAKKQKINLTFFYSVLTDKEMHNLGDKLNYKKGKTFFFFSKKLK
jgi:N-acetylglutamate synthase-like GNAT family acetyltransferase